MRKVRRYWWVLLPALALGWWLHARQAAGGSIVFLRGFNSYELYRINPNGSGLRRLLGSPAGSSHWWDVTPSADGEQVAFLKRGKRQTTLWVAKMDGTHQRQITDGSERSVTPAFFPDGRSLVYSSGPVPSVSGPTSAHLYRVNLDGAGKRQLTFGKSRDLLPVVSPDGQTIVFVSNRSRSGGSDLYRMNADGSGLRRLTTHPADDCYPAISPDGRRIAFASNRSGKNQIYLMDSNGRHLRRVTRGTTEWKADWPAFSPDGTRLVYSLAVVKPSGTITRDLCVIRIDGRGRTLLTNNALRYDLDRFLYKTGADRFIGPSNNYSALAPIWLPADPAGKP